MAAGLGFKTFTTGEVLTAADTNGYLMQGLLVFASAAARDAAITSPQEGQACYLKDTDAVLTYSGTAWVGFDDSNAIQNAIINAKGDLIAGSANDTPAILPAGSNGETLVADSSTTTGLRYQSGYNGNAIINGSMDIWQRGTSFTTTSGVAYTADRWSSHTIAAGGSVTTSRQTVSDTTNLPTIQYATKFQRVAANNNTGILSFFNTLESADSYRFAGQTATLSFYAKKGADYSAASSILVSNVASGTGTDQPLRSFTGITNNTQNNTLTTTYQRFYQTVTISAAATEVGVQFFFTPVGTAGADDSVFITGVQLELGSVATTFKRSAPGGGTIAGELAACQRYFAVVTTDSRFPSVVASATVVVGTALPVSMRTSPTLAFSGAATQTNVTSATLASVGINNPLVRNTILTTSGSNTDTFYVQNVTASAEL